MNPEILNDICLTIPIVVFLDRPHHTLLTLALRIWARRARVVPNICFSIMHIFTPERGFGILLLGIHLWLSSLEIWVRGLIIEWFSCFVDRFAFCFGAVALVLFKELLLTSFVLVLFALVIILAKNVILLRRTCESCLWRYLLKCWRHWLALFATLLATLLELLFWSGMLPRFSRVIDILTRLVVPMAIRLPRRSLLLWLLNRLLCLFLLRFVALIRSWRIKSLGRGLLCHNSCSGNLRLMRNGPSVSLAKDFGVILIFVDVALVFIGNTVLCRFLSWVNA
jgi:hypothetical protein